nr:hypothetical protein 3 [Gammaproteobacteria bacterium]
MELRRFMAKTIEPLARRVSLLVTRAVGKMVDPNELMQTLQVEVLAGEVLDNIEHFEPYGFTCHPQKGFEALIASIGGNRDHAVCFVASDRRYRPVGLLPGEVCWFTDEDKDASQHRIYFKRGKEIHLIAGASSIVMTPAGVTITTPRLDINEG